ncbi:MAG: GntR family transcriptional regulator [Bacteroidetes bacterium GWF2_33_16]|nr:MAG: GntR family transcriptional regulator [Bacteroidetes bacterium GWE2_32_14]OFY07026.1 MAG: GntR family transcriptional regulator [Bacteroidetes bacterium GWF2_33_16]
MIEIGKINTLTVVKFVDFGIYLDGGSKGEILVPKRYVPEEIKVGDPIAVFIYTDSEDRIIGTTEMPFAQVDEFAYMRVTSVNKIGAFLDWGLTKDLLVPFSEQKQDLEEGKSYIVRLFLDKFTDRVAATTKIDKFLNIELPTYQVNDQVNILIHSQTDIGYKAIVDNKFWGVLYENEVFRTLKRGQTLTAFIKKIRDDGKIDLTLEKPGFEKIDDLTDIIIEKLKANNGFIGVTDKSSPETIYGMFGTSKKTYKKAIGSLFKRRLIEILEDGIRLK